MIFNRKPSNTHTYRSLMRAATDSTNKYYISKRFSGDGRQLGSGVAPITGHLPRTDSLFALNFLQAGKAPMGVSFLFFLSCFIFFIFWLLLLFVACYCCCCCCCILFSLKSPFSFQSKCEIHFASFVSICCRGVMPFHSEIFLFAGIAGSLV